MPLLISAGAARRYRIAVPGVSDNTIRLVLDQLRNEGEIVVDGTGRTATWSRTPSETNPQNPLTNQLN
ncbi:MAG: hypothetical protein ACRDOI_29220 [Trebonia sp.]